MLTLHSSLRETSSTLSQAMINSDSFSKEQKTQKKEESQYPEAFPNTANQSIAEDTRSTSAVRNHLYW